MKKKNFNINPRKHESAWYGWKKDQKDSRDLLYKVERANEVVPVDQLPASIDLSAKFPPAYNQGELGSCTANAIAGGIQFIQQGFMPSRLFIYYNERVIEGDPGEDNGAQIRDGISSVADKGVCSESLWGYNTGCFANKPFFWCYVAAKKDVVSQYLSINGIQEMKSCLAAGFPFVFGFTVFQSFESDVVATTGIVPMPGPNDPSVGGHAVLCVGYDDVAKMFKVRNSWGADWGMAGFFTISYDYLTNPELASDMWTIRKDSGS